MIELVGAGKTYRNDKGVFDVSMRLDAGLTGIPGRHRSGKLTKMLTSPSPIGRSSAWRR